MLECGRVLLESDTEVPQEVSLPRETACAAVGHRVPGRMPSLRGTGIPRQGEHRADRVQQRAEGPIEFGTLTTPVSRGHRVLSRRKSAETDVNGEKRFTGETEQRRTNRAQCFATVCADGARAERPTRLAPRPRKRPEAGRSVRSPLLRCSCETVSP